MAFGDFTVVRAGTKWVLNSSGVLAEVANNVPAFEFNTDGTYRGLLVEPAGTNQVRNNTMVGAVAGSPGTFPTNWLSNTRGLTRTVVGTGTVNGVEYIDIQYAGTADITAGVQVGFEGTTQIVASNGQTWTNSFWFQVIAQPTPPINYRFVITERTDVGGSVAGGSLTISTPTVWNRYTQTRTLSGGGTVARVTPEFQADVTSGQSYDFTVRIGLPQMEQSTVATSVIKTSGSTANRVADSVTLTGASSLIGQTEGTFEVQAESRNPGISYSIMYLSDGTNNNRIALQSGTGTTWELRIVAGGVTQGTIALGNVDANLNTWRVVYSASAVSVYKNGVLTGTPLGAITLPSMTSIYPFNRHGGDLQLNGWGKYFWLSTQDVGAP